MGAQQRFDTDQSQSIDKEEFLAMQSPAVLAKFSKETIVSWFDAADINGNARCEKSHASGTAAAPLLPCSGQYVWPSAAPSAEQPGLFCQCQCRPAFQPKGRRPAAASTRCARCALRGIPSPGAPLQPN